VVKKSEMLYGAFVDPALGHSEKKTRVKTRYPLRIRMTGREVRSGGADRREGQRKQVVRECFAGVPVTRKKGQGKAGQGGNK